MSGKTFAYETSVVVGHLQLFHLSMLELARCNAATQSQTGHIQTAADSRYERQTADADVAGQLLLGGGSRKDFFFVAFPTSIGQKKKQNTVNKLNCPCST